jgi:hypothetical protein
MALVVNMSECSVTALGPPERNKIQFEVTTGEDLDRVEVRLFIPCGEKAGDKIFLLPKSTAKVTWDVVPGGTPNLPRPIANGIEVKTSSRGFPLTSSEKLVITIYSFLATDAGTASLQLEIKNNRKILYSEAPRVPVAPLPPQDPVKILGLSGPTKGRADQQVSISGYTANARRRGLFIGSNEIKQQDDLSKPYFNFVLNAPSDNTTLMVKAWRNDVPTAPDTPDDQAAFELHIEQQGVWDQRPLVANHYPALLQVSSPDLKGGTAKEKLYGVFIHETTGAPGLWSSESGFDDWELVDAFPEDMTDMGNSPGVICGGKLWLIGGSSADATGPRSNRVCCGYFQGEKWVWNDSDKKEVGAAGFSPRMGHACAVFGGEIWVLGGLGVDNYPLDDVWICTVKMRDPMSPEGFTTKWRAASQKLPAKVCMLAALATPETDRRFHEARLWIYGGTDHPNSLKGFPELRFIASEKDPWEKVLDVGPATGKTPLRATLLYAGGTLCIAVTYDGGVLCQLLTSVEPFRWDPTAGGGHPNWVGLQTDAFVMRSFYFNRRSVFYPVYMYMKDLKGKLPWVLVESD